jgi:hypothetical protein
MTTHTLLVFALALGVLQPAAIAQYVDNQEQRSGNTAPARPDEPRPLLTNVQVELTITDSMPSASPQKKTVSMVIVDGRMGRIRSTREHSTAVLNVDATPTIAGNQVRLQLSLEYSPAVAGDVTSPSRLAHINEMVTLMLHSGKPTVVSQTSDPSADRKVSVEVTATILK